MQNNDKIWDVGAGAAVICDGRVLMVRKTYGIGRGRWSLPGGFAEHEELLDETAVREVYEETGVQAVVESVVGMRTRHTEVGGAIYIIFRLRPVIAGEPVPDGEEIDGARYFSAEELLALEERETFALSRNTALAVLRGQGGLVETDCAPSSGSAYRAFIIE